MSTHGAFCCRPVIVPTAAASSCAMMIRGKETIMPELPTQEQFVRNKWGRFRRMNLVTRSSAFFQGFLLVAVGCCFPELYHWGMGCASTPKATTLIHRLAIGGLPVILIFWLVVCDGIRILLSAFQCCPHCHRWYYFWCSELVAGNQCPYCRNRLI